MELLSIMAGFGLGLSLGLVVILSVTNKEGLRVVSSSLGVGFSVLGAFPLGSGDGLEDENVKLGLVVSAEEEGLTLDSTLGRVEDVKLGLIVISSAEGLPEGHIVLCIADGLLLGAEEGISVSTMLGLSLGYFHKEQYSNKICERMVTVNLETQEKNANKPFELDSLKAIMLGH